jgi:hypothetical protein
MYRTIFTFLLLTFLLGCGGGSPDQSKSAPRIIDLTVTPAVICVGSTADIAFTLLDSDSDEIVWVAGLSSGKHGGVIPGTGRVHSGTRVTAKFEAATSGRHSHNVTLEIKGADLSGLEADPVKTDLFVFNCD